MPSDNTKPLSELDKAELRLEMRQMYRNIGFSGSMRCLYEILVAAEILSEVILDEKAKNPRS